MIIFFKKQSNNFKAITAMLLAVFCVTIMSVQAKLIGIEYNAVQITFARAIVVLILLMPFIYKLGGLNFLKTKKPFLHFFRGLAGLIGNVMFFLAFQRLPVADVTVISQAVPIFSCILAIIFLGETIGWRRWTAITIGFLGVIIAINPSVNIAVASLYALGGTLMWSTTIIFLRLLGSTEHPVKTVFYFMLVSVLITSIFQPFLWKEPSFEVILLFIGIGIAAFLTQLLMTYALQKAPASIVSPFNYTGIVWAIIFDYIIWNAHPMFATIFGGIIITISGIYIFKREAKIKSIK
ncbi:DMT family transporter [Alphaproteobacteria bacterium]|nr:DMT family transporter [Alphaproteobacteria bacterium]MDC0975736.1 DMT family transporter [Alphaproteobacteria bacterium]MDC1111723.1 DMT family transporter [Alphaproteobacteria bacterium]MDC3273387.1 DMT family transporter [Alphaproteobacteria bacterium]